jgi:hypothetical protein
MGFILRYSNIQISKVSQFSWSLIKRGGKLKDIPVKLFGVVKLRSVIAKTAVDNFLL